VAVHLFLATQHHDDERTMSLLSLEKGCSIDRRWIGIVPRMPSGLWLHCGTGEFLITEPLSLYGHVTLATTDDALQFVRFFTLASNDAYVRPEGLVEVRPDSAGDDFATVKPAVFRKLFHAPVVEKLRRGTTERVDMFSIQRVMLTPHGQVIDVTETVSANGYYDIISKRVVVRDASKIGLFYLTH
jgi:hypothetical protein